MSKRLWNQIQELNWQSDGDYRRGEEFIWNQSFLRKKQRNMDKDQIIKAASELGAESFLELMHHNHVFTEILDLDNISNANDGFLNVIVEGLPAGETLLFINGKLA